MDNSDISRLLDLIKVGEPTRIAEFMKDHDLMIKDGAIVPKTEQCKKTLKYWEDFWTQRNSARKVNLNGLYGAITNPGSRFCDQRLGQSTTLSGRSISYHMTAKINELLTGNYTNSGEVIIGGDTDSIAADSIIDTDIGQFTVERLFHMSRIKWGSGDKEYAVDERFKVKGYNASIMIDEFKDINYIYRHKVSKEKWEIEDITGNTIMVTNDHSVMVYRNDNLIEVKPRDLLADDCLVSLEDSNHTRVVMVKKVTQLENFNDEYVYDIGMKDGDPYFFANNILVHNSCYFTINPAKEELADQGFNLNKDTFVTLADSIANEVNESFIPFVEQAFHVAPERNTLIKCGREICATSAIFIKKKHYAILYYDKEGFRVDTNGKEGKLKIMGLATQRADTAKPVQEFLKEVLQQVLEGKSEKEVVQFIRGFRNIVKGLLPWEKGTPKRVNNLTKFTELHKTNSKNTIPGHVRASINYNNLRKMNDDNYSMSISDGQKVIVCELKPNEYNFKSIALPIDELNIPIWFKGLPFDHALMENNMVDVKLDNIIGILNWNLNISKLSSDFASLLMFE